MDQDYACHARTCLQIDSVARGTKQCGDGSMRSTQWSLLVGLWLDAVVHVQSVARAEPSARGEMDNQPCGQHGYTEGEEVHIRGTRDTQRTEAKAHEDSSSQKGAKCACLSLGCAMRDHKE